MSTFITTAAVTFVIFAAAALVFNYSKKRAENNKHGLTGMCHCSGGASCCNGTKNISKRD